LREAHEWLERYRQFWDGSLDRLELFLSTDEGSPQKNGKKAME
jgi:hypothetical protein